MGTNIALLVHAIERQAGRQVSIGEAEFQVNLRPAARKSLANTFNLAGKTKCSK